ncbi:hypothetical protein B4123_3464 [Bacillus paralicheniformis]|nr:hypothetical protein B4123_3464 [Bacillus paralicheniformis]
MINASFINHGIHHFCHPGNLLDVMHPDDIAPFLNTEAYTNDRKAAKDYISIKG